MSEATEMENSESEIINFANKKSEHEENVEMETKMQKTQLCEYSDKAFANSKEKSTQKKVAPKKKIHKPKTCDICHLVIENGHMKRHKNTVHFDLQPLSQPVYQCKKCKATFKRHTPLKRHIKKTMKDLSNVTSAQNHFMIRPS